MNNDMKSFTVFFSACNGYDRLKKMENDFDT